MAPPVDVKTTVGVARRLQHAQQADDVDLGVEGRPLDRRDDVGLRGEMEDRVRLDLERIADVVLHKAGRGVDVLPPSGRQVVDDGDLVAARDERVHDVRADESRTSGDDRSHGCILCPCNPRVTASSWRPTTARASSGR